MSQNDTNITPLVWKYRPNVHSVSRQYPTKLLIKMCVFTHIESLKFPTIPGLSPGVGERKQGLLALQMMPCTQGRVPADGMALLGK